MNIPAIATPKFAGTFSFFSKDASYEDVRSAPGQYGQGCFGPENQPDSFIECKPADDAQVSNLLIAKKIPFSYRPSPLSGMDTMA